ncbi:MAG: phage tail protein [Bacilli bacterium]|jgi:hypothetical protein
MAWPFFATFFLKLFIAVAISYLLAPRPKTTGVKASGIDAFKVTTAQVGREFPVLFGKKKLTSPNVVWYGDLKAVAIREKVSSGLFSSKKVTVGYKYHLGMHLVLAHDIDSITQIESDGKTAWTGTSTGGTITISAPDLFGGVKSGGGITGSVDFETGDSDQTPNDYLQSVYDTTDIPAFRGVACLVLRQVYLGTSEYIKEWHIWAKKIYNGWYAAKASIGDDMNPAHIIYTVLTDTEFGMGEDASSIDDAAFQSVADTLYSEGFGLSFMWDHSCEIGEFISEVLVHIDASLYTDLHTGCITLKLIRADYDIDVIPLFDENNIVEITSFRRRTLDDIANSVTVKFWNSSTGEDDSVTLADIAMVAVSGRTNNVEMDYPGITDPDLAASVAARDLRALSNPLANAVIRVNTEGIQLSPGSPFLLSWEQYGITQMVMRATNVEYGEFGDSSISIECAEDVFGAAAAVYDSAPASLWTSPSSAPAACPIHAAMEVPYHFLALEYGDAAVQALASTAGFAGVTGARPSGDALDMIPCYKLSTDSVYTEYEAVDFAAWCQPTVAVAISDTVLSVAWSGGYDVVEGGQWGVIDSEIVYVVSAGASSVTVARGCLDTVPAAHTTSANLLIFDDLPFSPTQYASGNTVNAKLLPRTGLGTLDIDDAAAQSIAVAGRLYKPYPPARLRINTLQEPDEFLLGETLTLTWKHRDRTAQTLLMVNTETNTDYGPETGTTYSLSVKRTDTMAELYSASGISANTVDVTSANIGYTGTIQVSLWSVRGGVASLQQQVRVFDYAIP